MKVRKIAAMLLAGVMAVSLVGCGSSSTSSDSSDNNAATDSGSAAAENTVERTKLTVGFDAEFPPYGYKDGDDYSGFDLDLAEAVCDYYGWELVKQPIDWDSKDMELTTGSIDCIWNGFTINGREDDYTWSEPYIDNSQVVVVKSDSGISSIDDLAGKIMDVQADSSALAALEGEDATEVGQQISASLGQLIQVSNYNTAFMDLESGAVDAIAMDVGVANYEISNREGDAYVILDEEISSEQYAIGFKKGNEELRDQVQEALEALVADGTVETILTEWSEMDDGAYSFLAETWCLE
ncbi:MAG: amino acid ABC transporter substrate-binding protein [Eubacteriales bacterium]|nr:amino acid ABC transporter substrate-binding protein [Eubacteriales bacterium]